MSQIISPKGFGNPTESKLNNPSGPESRMDSSSDDDQSIPHPDRFHFRSAQGWLMLGDVQEAETELHLISSPYQDHPDVLELRWLLFAQSDQWVECLKVARQLVASVPTRPFGWIHQAYALRRVPEGGLQAAWDALLPASAQFPDNLTILYNLSCYACQMGNMPEACRVLKKTFEKAKVLGDKETIRSMALADADLEPLWPEIRTW